VSAVYVLLAGFVGSGKLGSRCEFIRQAFDGGLGDGINIEPTESWLLFV